MAALKGFYLAATVVTLLLMVQSVAAAGSVVDILKENGLPEGLLPGTVTSYSLSDSGKFQVSLKSTCTTKIGSEEVYYKKSITGEVSYGQIKNLAGIQAREFFWVSVTGIETDKNNPNIIWFKVGFISKSLDIDLFQVAPSCNSLIEEEQDKDAMTFSDWLSKALSGTLDVNLLRISEIGAARKLQEG